MKYVMADIHGCWEEFQRMLEKIGFSDEDELFIIGDVIDRGPEPVRLLRYIMEQDNMILLMGNHEWMMLERYKSGDPKVWMEHGCEVTEEQFKVLPAEEQRRILTFLAGLPYGCEVEAGGKDYILIHGGPYEGFREQWEEGTLSEMVLWARLYTLDDEEEAVIPGKILITGHTPTACYGIEDQIISAGDIRLIDCGCVHGYSLACLCLDTEECFYVHLGETG